MRNFINADFITAEERLSLGVDFDDIEVNKKGGSTISKIKDVITAIVMAFASVIWFAMTYAILMVLHVI